MNRDPLTHKYGSSGSMPASKISSTISSAAKVYGSMIGESTREHIPIEEDTLKSQSMEQILINAARSYQRGIEKKPKVIQESTPKEPKAKISKKDLLEALASLLKNASEK